MVRTKDDLKAYANLYINTNGRNSISGKLLHDELIDIIDSLISRVDDATLLGLFGYDPTRNYVEGQGVLYDDGTGVNLWHCTGDTTGAFDPTKWEPVNETQAEYQYTIPALGTQDIPIGDINKSTILVEGILISESDEYVNLVSAKVANYFNKFALSHEFATADDGYLIDIELDTVKAGDIIYLRIVNMESFDLKFRFIKSTILKIT